VSNTTMRRGLLVCTALVGVACFALSMLCTDAPPAVSSALDQVVAGEFRESLGVDSDSVRNARPTASLHVVDEAGRDVQGAEVFLGLASGRFLCSQLALAESDVRGRAVVALGRTQTDDGTSLCVRKEGFCDATVNAVQPGAAYTVELQSGNRLIVYTRTPWGAPVPDARVVVS